MNKTDLETLKEMFEKAGVLFGETRGYGPFKKTLIEVGNNSSCTVFEFDILGSLLDVESYT